MMQPSHKKRQGGGERGGGKKRRKKRKKYEQNGLKKKSDSEFPVNSFDELFKCNILCGSKIHVAFLVGQVLRIKN